MINTTSIIQQQQKLWVIYKNQRVSTLVPPQIIGFSYLDDISAKDIQIFGFGFMAGNIMLNIFLSGIINYLWRALSELSSLTILFMIAIPVQGASQQLSAMVLQLAQLDILPTEAINGYLFEFNEDDQPVNHYFDSVGLSYHNSVRNLGSTFLFLVGWIALLFVISATALIGYQKVYNYLRQKLLWRYPIRFILQQFVTLYLASIINLYQMDDQYDGDMIANSAAIFIFQLCTVNLIVFTLLIVLRVKGLISSTTFTQKFGTLTENLKDKQYSSALFQVEGLFKSMLMMTILVAGRNYPGIQVPLLYFNQSFSRATSFIQNLSSKQQTTSLPLSMNCSFRLHSCSFSFPQTYRM
ncbi:hypothetical protein FGO68_gene3550 [Halteria grandinella]|uniref:Transmembrane protein n=1 Tax=Halteria grandinella TaxID=5974 RepID=A0A8J8T992_HALGN|nr:hypothetical protein FGO68_gene3550 [Halteria grandinella]